MIDVITVVGPLILPVLMLVGFGTAGSILERRHEAELSRREAAVSGFVLTDLATLPCSDLHGEGARLVTGNVVIGTGYLKQFFASLRTLVGGEVRSYQRVMERGRREAQLRMVEAARAQGARCVVNVRFETADVGGANPFAEIFCYGTLIR